METYFANQPLTITIPLVTSGGVAVTDATNATYRVLDEAGQELVAPTDFTPEAGTGLAEVTIDASVNELLFGDVRAYRMVEVTFVSGGNTYVCFEEYLIEVMDALIVMNNSFQTYAEAILRSAEMTGLTTFAGATRRDRIAALITAYRTLANLKYQVPSQGYGRGYGFGYDMGYGFNYSYSGAAPEWSPREQYINIPGLTLDKWNALHKGLTNALKVAQVIEANEALDAFSILKKRQQGLMSETIGESSMMFRPEKVLNLPVTRKSLDYLRPYLVWDLSAGRA